MLPPHSLPDDRARIHPWIARLLGQDADFIASEIRKRLSTPPVPETACLLARIDQFVPIQIEFSEGIGYVRCLRRAADGIPTEDVADEIYIAQPLPDEVLKHHVEFFHESVRPLMNDFLSKYAGCGEVAGQFMMDEASPADIEFYARGSNWEVSQRLYAARNSDSVFVNRQGATAWHVFEMHAIVPLFDSFSEFIRHYAAFRAIPEVFDSWTSREFIGIDPYE
jgi:hypothetical protein